MEGRENKTIPLCNILLDVLWLLCVGLPILILFLAVTPYKRGVFCDDDSLKHPYHDSTVPSFYLYIFGLGMNILVMCISEYVIYGNSKHTVTIAGGWSLRIPYWLWSAYCVVLVFLFGAACSQLTTDIMKYTVGRLRPHFLTVCKPDVCLSNQLGFMEDFKCTNELYKNNERIMKEMRLSFPSGHSSFSMYTMLYFAIYIQSRFKWGGSTLLRHTIQFCAITAALFTAMTRISDYKHHWSDVLAGLLLGACVACVVARYISTLFRKNDLDIRREMMNGGNEQMDTIAC